MADKSDTFDESVQIDDPKPFVSWVPSQKQIAEFSAIVRSGWTPAERMRHMNPALRPIVRNADGSAEEMDGDDYENHLSNHERNRR